MYTVYHASLHTYHCTLHKPYTLNTPYASSKHPLRKSYTRLTHALHTPYTRPTQVLRTPYTSPTHALHKSYKLPTHDLEHASAGESSSFLPQMTVPQRHSPGHAMATLVMQMCGSHFWTTGCTRLGYYDSRLYTHRIYMLA